MVCSRQRLPLRDTAVNEEIELNVGSSPDVQIKSVKEKTNIYTRPPFLEGVVRFKSALIDEIIGDDLHRYLAGFDSATLTAGVIAVALTGG